LAAGRPGAAEQDRDIHRTWRPTPHSGVDRPQLSSHSTVQYLPGSSHTASGYIHPFFRTIYISILLTLASRPFCCCILCTWSKTCKSQRRLRRFVQTRVSISPRWRRRPRLKPGRRTRSARSPPVESARLAAAIRTPLTSPHPSHIFPPPNRKELCLPLATQSV